MKINIERNLYGSLFAIDAESQTILFQFEYRRKDLGGPAWFFWLRGNLDPDTIEGKKKDFPMQFFKDACKAKAFIFNGVMPDEVEIVRGEDNLSK